MSDEIGRELLFFDLKVRSIVVVKPPDPQQRGIHLTFWVTHASADHVTFWSGVKRMYVIAFRGAGDTVIDDRGRRVAVYEYRGEP